MNMESMTGKNRRIPNAPEKRKSKVLGRYGQLRKAFLKSRNPDAYGELVQQGQLETHCSAMDHEARNRMEQLLVPLAKGIGATDEMKKNDLMAWGRLMKICRDQAEQIVLLDIVCK